MRRILVTCLLLAIPCQAQQASRDFDDATAEYLTGDGASNPDFTVPFSMAGWIYRDGTGARHIVLATHGYAYDDTYHGAEIAVSSGDQLWCQYGDGGSVTASNRRSFYSTETLGSGAWIHVACTITGATTGTLWVNGVAQTLNTSGSGDSVTMDNADPMYVGGYDSIYTGTTDGLVAYTALWDREITVDEVAVLQRCTPWAIMGGLEHYIPLDSATEGDWIGGESFTATGTAVSTDGPPVAKVCYGPQ